MLIFHRFFNDLGGSDSKMLIFHWFFNDFEGVGLENVDFPLVFQWFLGCSLSRRFSAGFLPVPGTDPPYAPGEDSGILFTT